jgi:hypothetical protein
MVPAREETSRQVNALDVIGHVLEQGMAELLSNPRLETAIKLQSRVVSRPTVVRQSGSSKSKVGR